MPAIAFFPWAQIDELVEVGPVRLLPYVRGKLAGDRPHASQRDIDGVLAAYAIHGQQRVRQAALLEVGDWRTGTEADAAVSDLFGARRALGFAALADRRLFTHFEYCNFDTYMLIVQRFQTGATDSFAFTTRRRDGGTTHTWSTSSFAFHRPNHVDGNAMMRLDAALLVAVLKLRPPGHAHFLEAMDEFNLANTDSSDVPMHTEVVMMKSAFEWMVPDRREGHELREGAHRPAFRSSARTIKNRPPAIGVGSSLAARQAPARSLQCAQSSR